MNLLEPTRDLRRRSCAPGILVIACLVLSSVASAQTVYKCVDSKNQIAFQQTPCQSGQRESEVAIKASPPPPPPPRSTAAPSRQSATSAKDLATFLQRVSPPDAAQVRSEPIVQSYECITFLGDVFYWHSPCPKVVEDGSSVTRNGWTIEQGPHYLSVTAGKPVPRALACQNMRSPGRSGRKYDQQTSTYDRNLGRDPCKNY